jgi:putative toxin-antitoxin system antitoxin component (TIGR02293 family)
VGQTSRVCSASVALDYCHNGRNEVRFKYGCSCENEGDLYERRPVTSRPARFGNRGASLGIRSAGTPQLIEQLEAGFPFDALRKFESNSGVAAAELVSILGIPERTLARRRTAGRLAPEESERLLRISNVFEKAVELFDDDVASAVQWLTTPKKALGGGIPLRYARTEPGAREVENLIGRLEYGVFS